MGVFLRRYGELRAAYIIRGALGLRRANLLTREAFPPLRRALRPLEGLRKHIERFGEEARDECGFNRGEHAGTMRFEQGIRRARASGRSFERPAEMLARMTQPDLAAVEVERFAVERAHERELFAKRRRRFALPGLQVPRQLSV